MNVKKILKRHFILLENKQSLLQKYKQLKGFINNIKIAKQSKKPKRIVLYKSSKKARLKYHKKLLLYIIY